MLYTIYEHINLPVLLQIHGNVKLMNGYYKKVFLVVVVFFISFYFGLPHYRTMARIERVYIWYMVYGINIIYPGKKIN